MDVRGPVISLLAAALLAVPASAASAASAGTASACPSSPAMPGSAAVIANPDMRGAIAGVGADTGGLAIPASWSENGMGPCTTWQAAVAAFGATDIVMGWTAQIIGPGMTLNFVGADVLGNDKDVFGVTVPLADLAGMTTAAITRPDNPDVLRIAMNLRQTSIAYGQGGVWGVSKDLAAKLGPALTKDMYTWLGDNRTITQGDAGGPIPPVPGDGGLTDPGAGIYCAFFPYAGTPPHPDPGAPCWAPAPTIDANGVVHWPGYPASVTHTAPTPTTPATVVTHAATTVTQGVNTLATAVTPKKSSSASSAASTVAPKASNSSTVSNSAPAAASSASAPAPQGPTVALPHVPPTPTPTPAQALAAAAASSDKPTPVGGVCGTAGTPLPCTQDPAYVGNVTPSAVSQAAAGLSGRAATNVLRSAWRNRSAIGLLAGALALILGAIGVLAGRPQRWGDYVQVPAARTVGWFLLALGIPVAAISLAVFLANPLIR